MINSELGKMTRSMSFSCKVVLRKWDERQTDPGQEWLLATRVGQRMSYACNPRTPRLCRIIDSSIPALSWCSLAQPQHLGTRLGDSETPLTPSASSVLYGCSSTIWYLTNFPGGSLACSSLRMICPNHSSNLHENVFLSQKCLSFKEEKKCLTFC